MATLDRQYKMNISVNYEIKYKGKELVLQVPIKKQLKQIKRLEKYLSKLKSLGWEVSEVEVSVE